MEPVNARGIGPIEISKAQIEKKSEKMEDIKFSPASQRGNRRK